MHQELPLDDIYRNFQLPKIGSGLDSHECMELAWQIAWQGVGGVGINPLVGAVAVTKEHKFLGAGYHQKIGSDHAEVRLVKNIQASGLVDQLAQAVIYITLEPCAHEGHTGSCAKMLASLPLARVVYGLQDISKKTRGIGPEILRQKGIEVCKFQGMDDKLQLLLDHFEWYLQTNKPYTGIKVASTLSGAYASTGSKRLWITGKRARAYGHWLRLWYDAILVGKNTLVLDNPSLNIRALKNHRTPLRVIVDPSGAGLLSRSLMEHQVINIAPQKTLWCAFDTFWNKLPIELLEEMDQLGVKRFAISSKEKSTALEQITDELGKRHIASLLIEGGSGVWGGFINSKLAKRAHFFYSLEVCNKADRLYWMNSIKQEFILSQQNTYMLEQDMLIEGNISYDQ